MKKTLTALFTLTLSLSAGAAYAGEKSDVLYVTEKTSYLLQGVGAVASDGPVTQGGFTHSDGKWSFDLWGSYGEKGCGANEVDLSAFYNDKAGPFKIQLAGQYYALNLHCNSLGKTGDDLVELYADVSLPFTKGKLTVAPLVRIEQMVGVNELDSFTLVDPGVRVAYQATPKLGFSGEVRDSINATQGGSTWRYDLSANYQVTDHWSVNGGIGGFKTSDTSKSVFSLGVARKF